MQRLLPLGKIMGAVLILFAFGILAHSTWQPSQGGETSPLSLQLNALLLDLTRHLQNAETIPADILLNDHRAFAETLAGDLPSPSSPNPAQEHAQRLFQKMQNALQDFLREEEQG